MSSDGPILYGHRGAAAELPENTLESFRRALERGADALETDVHLTLDGRVVVSHDESGRRMAGVPREIRRSLLAEVQSWDAGFGFLGPRGERPFLGRGFRVPTFDEVLEAFPGVLFNVDVKQTDPPMVRPLLEVIRRHGAEGRVQIASFSDEVLSQVRALGYRGRMALGRRDLQRLLVTPARLIRAGLVAVEGELAQVPLRYGPVRFATRAFLGKCHALGIRVDFWTINSEEIARFLVELGADGIMTDDPGRIAKVLSAARGCVVGQAPL